MRRADNCCTSPCRSYIRLESVAVRDLRVVTLCEKIGVVIELVIGYHTVTGSDWIEDILSDNNRHSKKDLHSLSSVAAV